MHFYATAPDCQAFQRTRPTEILPAARGGGIHIAYPFPMSRVEPSHTLPPPREAERRREPDKAEGDEKTVEEALRRQEEAQTESESGDRQLDSPGSAVHPAAICDK